MKHLDIAYSVKNAPKLDPGFVLCNENLARKQVFIAGYEIQKCINNQQKEAVRIKQPLFCVKSRRIKRLNTPKISEPFPNE